jgi:branched-subunit amino acid transport protein
MTGSLVVLALLMAAVTYPSRALPILAPGIERLPPRVLEYLRLIGPAILAALAGVNALVDSSGSSPRLQLGAEALAVVVCVAIVAWRRNLLPGLLAAVALVAIARALGAG